MRQKPYWYASYLDGWEDTAMVLVTMAAVGMVLAVSVLSWG